MPKRISRVASQEKTAQLAAWAAAGTVNGSAQSFVPFLWAVGDPNARLMVPSAIVTLTISDGWLTWNDGSDPARLRGALLAAIPGLEH